MLETARARPSSRRGKPTVATATSTTSARVEIPAALCEVVDGLLRRSPRLRGDWERLLGCSRLSLRLETTPAPADGEASVTSEAFDADGEAVFTTVYVANGRALRQALGAEVVRLTAYLDTVRAASQEAPSRDDGDTRGH